MSPQPPGAGTALPRFAGRIRRWLLGSANPRPANERADSAPLVAAPPGDGVQRLPPGEPQMGPFDLAGLEKQLAKLGREQFKLNALIEAQQQTNRDALQRLQELDERRDRERAELLARREADRIEARLQVIVRLLPVMDGLDEALMAAIKLQASMPLPERMIESTRLRTSHHRELVPSRVERAIVWGIMLLGQVFPGLLRRSEPEPAQPIPSAWATWKDAYLSWLQGLDLVRDRLLGALAAEGVQPIETCGHPFDPHHHAAAATSPAGPHAPGGTVIAEVRRGYAFGDRVLRYAEVVVARDVGSPQGEPGEMQDGLSPVSSPCDFVAKSRRT